MRCLRRCRVLAVVAAAAVLLMTLASCGGGSSGTSGKDAKITVVWNSTPDIAYLPLLMAIESLNEDGYNVQAKTLSGADVAAQALASNRAQFTSDNITGAANAIKMGAPISVVSVASANEAVWVTKSGYKDCADLDGEPVGIFAPAESSGYTKEMNAYFERECPGVSPKLVTIPDSALRAQALANDQIEATVLALSDAVTLTTKLDPSAKYRVLSFQKEFPGLADNYLFANEQVLQDNSEVVEALITAQLEAVRRIYKHPEHLPKLLQTHLSSKKYTPQVAKAAAKRKTWYANGGLDKTGMQGLDETLELFELPGSASEIVQKGPLESVLKDIGMSSATGR